MRQVWQIFLLTATAARTILAPPEHEKRETAMFPRQL
jgi:hypothetical protein